MACPLVCGTPAGVAQSSGNETAAQKAGEYAAFRQLLIPRRDACYIGQDDYREQDSAAERLFFGLYNPNYGGRGTPKTADFLEQAKQQTSLVVGAPKEYDLSPVCAAVQQEIKAFHPRASIPSMDPRGEWCGTWSPHACWCDVPNFTPPQSACASASVPASQTWTPNSAWRHSPGQSLSTGNLTVYTDYCYGHTMDGIMFLPKTTGAPTPPETPQSEPACDAKNVHIRQFVYTRCVGGFQQCGKSYPTTCGYDRKLYTWYLDECSSDPQHTIPGVQHHLTPDGDAGGVHVISDEPTVNLTLEDSPIQKDFVDVVICDDGKTPPKVLGALGWTRTGIKSPQTPQWCSLPPPRKDVTVSRLVAAPYSDLRQLDARSQDVRDAVCHATDNMNVADAGLIAIINNFGQCAD